MVEAHWLVAKRDRLIAVKEQMCIHESTTELRGFNNIVVEY